MRAKRARELRRAGLPSDLKAARSKEYRAAVEARYASTSEATEDYRIAETKARATRNREHDAAWERYREVKERIRVGYEQLAAEREAYRSHPPRPSEDRAEPGRAGEARGDDTD